MIENERNIRRNLVIEAAHQLMIAARTAPKAKGCDIIEIALVSDRSDLEALAAEMRRQADITGMKFLLRDADNIPAGAYCGYESCALKPDYVPCAFNSIDVGIAVGSVCSRAADLRLDSRVMFSAGWCSQKLNWLPDCSLSIAIALGAASKNPFFDRKPKEEPAK